MRNDYNQIAPACLDAGSGKPCNSAMLDYLLPIAAYLLGSLSSAVLIARLFRLQDPREVGSGNPGATNVLRYGGKKAAAMTLAGDILKGVVAVLVARLLTTDKTIIALVLVAVFLGHLYPVFFRFKGGKGVATAFGGLVALNPWIGLAQVVTWFAVAVTTRYSSLSALTAATLSPAFVWYWSRSFEYILASLAITLLLFWRHRANIKRLLAGTEGKIGKKS